MAAADSASTAQLRADTAQLYRAAAPLAAGSPRAGCKPAGLTRAGRPWIRIESIVIAIVLVLVLVLVLVMVVGVFPLVPVISDEIDRTPAGVIVVTTLPPVFLLSGAYVQVHRRRGGILGCRLDHDRSSVYHGRVWIAADVDLAVHID